MTLLPLVRYACLLPAAFALLFSPQLVMCQQSAPVAASPKAKKLIEWGFDQPTTTRLRNDIVNMEKSPFDGVVLAAYGLDAEKKQVNLAWDAFGAKPYSKEQFTTAVEDLKATHFKKFTDNFLRVNVTPGDVDWFDDAGWSVICSHGAVAGWICSQGRLKGIMFDTEQYNKKGRLFYYQEVPGKEKHTFKEYVAQVKKRGFEFGTALSAEKPDISILFTYTGSYQIVAEKAPLEWTILGMLPAFIDGMMAGANSKAKFVDGLETAYGAKDAGELNRLRSSVYEADKLSSDKAAFDARMTVGFGLWLDKDWQKNGWDPANLTRNYFQPVEFETAVRTALDLSDRYVWIYSEKLNWWTGAGISPAYAQALEKAKVR